MGWVGVVGAVVVGMVGTGWIGVGIAEGRVVGWWGGRG